MCNEMTESQKVEVELICGVERDIIEDFFALVKIAYPLVDKANYFLEIETGISGINIGITNERDALSHFHTILTDSTLTYLDRRDQLSTLEEHFRRAIMEPYYRAISIIIDKHIRKLYVDYKEKVLPLKVSDLTLSSAPTIEQIDNQLGHINKARAKARDAKRINKLDEKWAEGVELSIQTFEDVKKLRATLEDYLVRAENSKSNKINKKMAWTQIILGVIFFVAGIFITLLFTKLTH